VSGMPVVGANWQQPAPVPPPAPPQSQGGSIWSQLEWPGDVRDAGGSSSFWWWGIVVLVLGLAIGLRWRRSSGVLAIATPDAPPRATALVRLRELVPPSDGALFAAFYVALKALLRLHASERFAIAADTATSEELQRRLPVNRDLSASLAACDGVLFAAKTPRAAEHAAAHAAALQWVSTTQAEAT
jgi:hypothetical protein